MVLIVITKIYDEGDHKTIICGIDNLDLNQIKSSLHYRGYRKINLIDFLK